MPGKMDETALTLGKIRILITDDHAVLRDSLQVFLQTQDDMMVVGQASNGAEAIAMTDTLSPDLVLMDIFLPDFSGLYATRQITERFPRTRVLVLTQHESKEYVKSILKAGAAGYVVKTAAGAQLLDAIRTVYRGQVYVQPSIAKLLVEIVLEQGNAEASNPLDMLTEREREILVLVAQGGTSRAIAAKLHISTKTVEGHRTSIMRKLEVSNQSELVRFAIRHKVIPGNL